MMVAVTTDDRVQLDAVNIKCCMQRRNSRTKVYVYEIGYLRVKNDYKIICRTRILFCAHFKYYIVVPTPFSIRMSFLDPFISRSAVISRYSPAGLLFL